MKIPYLSLAAFLLAGRAAAQTGLKCPDYAAGVRSLKVMHMQPVRRGKRWLDGVPTDVLAVSCDRQGLKTSEEQYDGKALALKRAYVYSGAPEARKFCENLKSEEKRTTSFSEEGNTSLDDFCRRDKKKGFTMAAVYDSSPAAAKSGRAKPLHRVFRLFDKRGLLRKEYSFDSFDSLESVTDYDYDKKNRLTQTTVTDPDGGQLRRETFSGGGPAVPRIHSVYGETNQLKRKTVDESRVDGTLRRETITDYDSAEQPVRRSEIYMDTSGVPQKELVFDPDDQQPREEYDYKHELDKKGNWTEEWRTHVMFFNGSPVRDSDSPPEITKREFIYY